MKRMRMKKCRVDISVQPSHRRKVNVQRESEKNEADRVSNGYKCLIDPHKTDERESYRKTMKMKIMKMTAVATVSNGYKHRIGV